MNYGKRTIDDQNKDCETLIWITKTTRDGDTNARIGIAEHIRGQIYELEIPTDFCSSDQILVRLVNANLIYLQNIKWPDVLIGPCFHIPYMQAIKLLSGNKTIVIALRPPVRGLKIKANKQDIANTNLIISYPYHDNTDIPNLLICETIANRVTSQNLAEARSHWATDFLPFSGHGPTIGLLMGGDIGEGRKIFPANLAAQLGENINEIAKKMKGSILASVSARTSDGCKQALLSKITVPYYIYDPKIAPANNPYFGILSSADYIITTADSISMCCEAVSSGKPVYIFHNKDIVENSHTEIVSHLLTQGFARLLDGNEYLEKFTYSAANSAKIIADEVHKMLSEI